MSKKKDRKKMNPKKLGIVKRWGSKDHYTVGQQAKGLSDVEEAEYELKKRR
jgi:hypothetical protein